MRGKSTFITGACSGIGRAITQKFIDGGWEVFGLVRSPECVDELKSLGDLGRFWVGDATDEVALAGIARDLEGSGLSSLVNCAGRFAPGAFRDTDAALLERLWRANVLTAFTVTRALLDELASNRGRIVNIVSIGALKPLVGKAAYCSAKAAQAALFKCLREEAADQGVSVTNVYPGLTFTSSFDGEDVDPSQMLAAAHVADAVHFSCVEPGNCAIEELVLQPVTGMRL